jgi:hypothetical protein
MICMMTFDLDSGINSLISGFDTISLEEIDFLNLLDRQDKKYIFNVNYLEFVLRKIIDSYSVLEINGEKIFHYNNIYFDTSDHLLYHIHHNGKLSRYKIRLRNYKETGQSFLEVKFKTNKEQIIKHRIPYNKNDLNTQKANSLINKNTKLNPDELEPKLTIDYSRITFANKNFNEKLTIDFNLNFKNSKDKATLPGLIIAEIKQNNLIETTRFQKIMKCSKIRSEAISKYCTGSILTNPNLKYNRFKSKMNNINKICREYNGS